jgi:hypothetical protein
MTRSDRVAVVQLVVQKSGTRQYVKSKKAKSPSQINDLGFFVAGAVEKTRFNTAPQ